MSGVLEVCVDSAAGLAAAIAGGADRIELCSALALGGLTPTPGLMSLAAACPLPVMALIRPSAGDFVYRPAEFDLMLREIDAVRAAGLAGVVVGVTRGDRLDEIALSRLAKQADGLRLALHRAIDVVAETGPALDLVSALGFERVLSSGGAATAVAGLARLERMREEVAKRVTIMPGAGITAATAGPLLSAGFRELHASCARPVAGAKGPALRLGFARSDARETDQSAVAALKAAITRGAAPAP